MLANIDKDSQIAFTAPRLSNDVSVFEQTGKSNEAEAKYREALTRAPTTWRSV